MSAPLQDRYAPNSICFGCGPANKKGLLIKSFAPEDKDGEVLCEWTPESHHEAFPGVLNGGIIGALLDCHSNWTASWYIMKMRGKEHPDCTVTAEFKVSLLRPCPADASVKLKAKVTEVGEKKDRVTVVSELISTANDKVCARCEGVFVAVTEGHPAYHRWN